MRRPSLVVGAIVTTLALLAPGVQAAKKLRVVVTIPDLKSLTEAVGGDLVEVDALTRGTQNFHEAEVRPSMMLRSEEHTSELQSHSDLVCRLLLEKKKIRKRMQKSINKTQQSYIEDRSIHHARVRGHRY